MRPVLVALFGLVTAAVVSTSCAGTKDEEAAKPPEDPCAAGEDACGSLVCDHAPSSGATEPVPTSGGGGDAGHGRDAADVEAGAKSDAGAPATAQAPGGAEGAAHPPVWVSLTFDDTFADQAVLLDILREVDMRATLYVNSARIGERQYLTAEQLRAFAAEGHEIAGHTVTHPTLPAVDADEQKRQICNDRVALLGLGFAPKSFAYPHGAFTPETQAIVKTCGYNSARVVGGLGCSGCPGGEPGAPLAPGSYDKLAIRSPTSVKCNTTLADLEHQVTTAEDNGGGWVPMVFHHVCDGCGRNAVSPALFRDFVRWLAQRRVHGTEVRTVDQMIGGDLAPGVPGPPAAPPRARTGNLLADPGLEDVDRSSDDIARCWVKGGEGANTFKFGRTSDAHSGAWAEWLEVLAFTDGARRIYSRQDLGYCAPVVQPKKRYRVSAWYKSTAAPRFTIYYREPSGFWKYWITSKPMPTSDVWTQQTFELPETPDEASSVSIALSLMSEGRIVMDDLALIAADE